MENPKNILGNVIKRTREARHLTQQEVADLSNIDVRTLLNIENYRGNPNFAVLWSLVRTLNINTQEIFFPEMFQKSSSIVYLQQLVGNCSEYEAETLIPILVALLNALRSNKSES